MAKFKIGDTVIGNKDNWYGKTGIGVKCKVVGIPNSYCIIVELHGERFTVNPRYFDLVRSNPDTEQITITRHGNKVVAKYGKKVGVAKCSPEDTFDFATGAKLAFNRLMGEPVDKPENEPKPKPKFEVGEFAKVTWNGYPVPHHFPVGSIVQIKGDSPIVGVKMCYGLVSLGTGFNFTEEWVPEDHLAKISGVKHGCNIDEIIPF